MSNEKSNEKSGKKSGKATRPKTESPITESRTPASRTSRRVQKFHVRCRFLGLLNVVCPCCGQILRVRLMQRHYWFQCTHCHVQYVPKLSLLMMPGGGKKRIPADFVIPDADGPQALREAFPLGDMGKWKFGGCTHEMLIVGESGENEAEEAEEVTKQGTNK